MALSPSEVRQLLLQVDASVELAKRNLDSLKGAVAADAAAIDESLGKIDTGTNRAGLGFGKLAGLAAGFLATISVGAVVSFGQQILQMADEMDTAARQAGVSIERYQTLSEAFRALDQDAGRVDTVLQTLQATLGDVQSGVENNATKALDQLGITAEIMNGRIKTSDQLLDALAASAEKAGSQAQFTADIVKIFGREVGVDLANALADGGAALHQLEQDMINTGTVIDREMIKKLSDASEVIESFKERSKRQFVIWAADTISAIETAMNWVDRLQLKLAQLSPFGKPETYQAAVNAHEARNIETLVQQQAWRVAEAKGKLQAADNARQAGRGIGGWNDPNASVNFWIRETRERAAELERLTSVRNAVRPSGGDSAPPPFVPRPDEPDKGRSRRTGGGRSRSARSAKPEPTLEELRLGFLMESPTPLLDDMNIKPALEDLKLMVDTARLLDETIASLPDISHVIPKETLEQFERFKDGVALFSEDVLRVAAGLDDWTVEDLLGSLHELLVQLLIIEPIVNSIRESMNGWKLGSGAAGGGPFAFLTGVLQSVGGLFGGGSAGINVNSGALNSAIAASLPGRAGGGPVSGGHPYMVGERGPELFVPKVSGSIVPNHALGGGLTILVDARDAVLASTVRQWIAEGVEIASVRGATGGAALAQQRAAAAARRRL